MAEKPDISVLFVCMGNICRSPTAHGVFLSLLERHRLSQRIMVDSAGTHAYHVGEPPDARAQRTATRRGVDLTSLRARQVSVRDFGRFDYLIAMDRENYRGLETLCPREYRDRLYLFLDFATDVEETDVPDPYYGGRDGFDRVFDMVELAAQGLLDDIRRRLRHSS